MAKSLEQQDREKFLALALLADTDGGKIISATALADITHSVERLSSDYKTATHTELIVLCANLNSRLSLYRALTRAEKHLKSIDEMLKEAIEDTDE